MQTHLRKTTAHQHTYIHAYIHTYTRIYIANASSHETGSTTYIHTCTHTSQLKQTPQLKQTHRQTRLGPRHTYIHTYIYVHITRSSSKHIVRRDWVLDKARGRMLRARRKPQSVRVARRLNILGHASERRVCEGSAHDDTKQAGRESS
jgi:hypothetical protein